MAESTQKRLDTFFGLAYKAYKLLSVPSLPQRDLFVRKRETNGCGHQENSEKFIGESKCIKIGAEAEEMVSKSKNRFDMDERVSTGSNTLADLVPKEININKLSQSDFPRIAKDNELCKKIHAAIQRIPTSQRIISGDSRNMNALKDESVHLVVTSPPYWTLKEYRKIRGQLGHIVDYDQFLIELDKTWRECYRVLSPGGRLVVVIGDVCLSRRKHDRHRVMPLHASIQEHCRKIGFDNLAPIIWYKIANISLEVSNGSRFLGKPYEPNAIIKNDIEYLLFQRKPGGYRTPDSAKRVLSIISEEDHRKWFQQIWTIPGESTRNHPSPFPPALAEQLVRMFSFVGDTVLDPFMGTGTTLLAAGMWGRNGVGYEIDPRYCQYSIERLQKNLTHAEIIAEGMMD